MRESLGGGDVADRCIVCRLRMNHLQLDYTKCLLCLGIFAMVGVWLLVSCRNIEPESETLLLPTPSLSVAPTYNIGQMLNRRLPTTDTLDNGGIVTYTGAFYAGGRILTETISLPDGSQSLTTYTYYDQENQQSSTRILVSPDSSLAISFRCYQDASTDIWHCSTTFPNDTTMRGESFTWLPNNRFIIAHLCEFHDSPCWGNNVWDVVSGKLLGSSRYGWFQISPSKDYLAYLETAYEPQTPTHLILLDLSTGQLTYPEKCPDWAKLPSWAAVELCDGVD